MLFLVFPVNLGHCLLFSSQDSSQSRLALVWENRAALEKILTFGRDLQSMSINLKREHGKNERNKKALQVSVMVIFLVFPTSGVVVILCSAFSNRFWRVGYLLGGIG